MSKKNENIKHKNKVYFSFLQLKEKIILDILLKFLIVSKTDLISV